MQIHQPSLVDVCKDNKNLTLRHLIGQRTQALFKNNERLKINYL